MITKIKPNKSGDVVQDWVAFYRRERGMRLEAMARLAEVEALKDAEVPDSATPPSTVNESRGEPK